jgi:hypothetical protein
MHLRAALTARTGMAVAFVLLTRAPGRGAWGVSFPAKVSDSMAEQPPVFSLKMCLLRKPAV